MTSSLVLKASLGVGGVAVVTGAAIGIPKLLAGREKSISELIKTKNPKKRPITSISLNDDDWKVSWEAYRKANKGVAKGKDTFKLSDWNGPIAEEISTAPAFQTFLDACFENSKKKVSEDSQLYKDVLSYCTRGTSVADLIKDSGKTVLSKGTALTTKEWQDAWERYRLANRTLDSDVWGVGTFSSVKDNQNKQVPEDFGTKCETHLKSNDISNLDFLDKVKDWCTVEGK